MATVTAPKRMASPGPVVAMNRTAQLRMQKNLTPQQSPFKTRQINGTIRSRMEIFEKKGGQPVPNKQVTPVVQKQKTLPLNKDEGKEIVVIENVSKKEKTNKTEETNQVKKYETIDVPIRSPILAISVRPWTSSGQVVTDHDSKQAEALLAERRKLIEEAETKLDVVLRPNGSLTIDENVRESSGASLDTSFPRAIDLAKHNQRPLWRDIRGIQELGLLENLTKEARTRQEAKFELMLSEATFLHSLNILNLHYMKNIQKHIPQVLTEKDYEILFKHALEVRSCSEAFLEELDKIWQSDPMLNNIYGVVTLYANDNFGPYVKYCRNMLDMRNHLVHMTTTNNDFKALLDLLINREGAQKLSLDSFLTSPMQRITKLPLLLKTILDKVELDSEEHSQCSAAYDAVTKIATECDTVVTEKKQMEELLKLSNDLEFGEDRKSVPIVIPGRSLISRASVKHFAFRDKAPKREKLELILFSDLLLICKKKGDKLRIVVDYCDRDKVQLKEMDNPTLYGHGENSKQIKPFVITMLNNSQEKKLDLVVTFKDKLQCKEWLGIFAVESDNNLNVVQVIALQEHEATQPDQLCFSPGDVIQFIGLEIDGWCEGELISDGQKGKFPVEKTAQLSTLVKTKPRNADSFEEKPKNGDIEEKPKETVNAAEPIENSNTLVENPEEGKQPDAPEADELII